MTTEQRYVLDVADILTIRIDCADCKAALSVYATDWKDAPTECPNCGQSWEHPGKTRAPLRLFAEALRDLIAQMKSETPAMPYRVRLELARPKD